MIILVNKDIADIVSSAVPSLVEPLGILGKLDCKLLEKQLIKICLIFTHYCGGL